MAKEFKESKFKRGAPFCACGCGERVRWNKNKRRWNIYLHGHHCRGENNPMKRPEIKALFMGDNNCMRKPEFIKKKSGENHHYYGEKRSKEDCDKISKTKISQKLKHTDEWKENLSKRLLALGDDHPSKKTENIKRMKEQKYAKGNKHTEEFKKKASERMLSFGESHWMKLPEHKKRVTDQFLGKCRPEFSGEKHPNWKGGIANSPYCEIWRDKEFKQSIKDRDDNKCQNPDCWNASNKLCGHHINYIKKDCNPWNVITVCTSCNARANFKREYWQEFYQNIMTEKHGYNKEKYAS